MSDEPDAVNVLAPIFYGLAGTVLLAIAGMLFVNLDQASEFLAVLTVVFAATTGRCSGVEQRLAT